MTKMPRRTACPGRAQKPPTIAIAIMHQPILSYIARPISDAPKRMISRAFRLRKRLSSGSWSIYPLMMPQAHFMGS